MQRRVGEKYSQITIARRYIARNATVTGTRAARIAGINPPMRPMHNAHTTPSQTSEGVTAR